MSYSIVVSCVAHPKYKALQPPRVPCKDCQKLYALRWEIADVSSLYNKGSRPIARGVDGLPVDLQPRDFRGGTVLTPYIIKGLG